MSQPITTSTAVPATATTDHQITRHISGSYVSWTVLILSAIGTAIALAIMHRQKGQRWVIGWSIGAVLLLPLARCGFRGIRYQTTPWQVLRLSEADRTRIEKQYQTMEAAGGAPLATYSRLFKEHDLILQNVAQRAHSYNDVESYLYENYRLSFNLSLNVDKGDYTAYVCRVMLNTHQLIYSSYQACRGSGNQSAWVQALHSGGCMASRTGTFTQLIVSADPSRLSLSAYLNGLFNQLRDDKGERLTREEARRYLRDQSGVGTPIVTQTANGPVQESDIEAYLKEISDPMGWTIAS